MTSERDKNVTCTDALDYAAVDSFNVCTEAAAAGLLKEFCQYCCLVAGTSGSIHVLDWVSLGWIHGRNHLFKVGGPVLWSRVLLPFYRKK